MGLYIQDIEELLEKLFNKENSYDSTLINVRILSSSANENQQWNKPLVHTKDFIKN